MDLKIVVAGEEKQPQVTMVAYTCHQFWGNIRGEHFLNLGHTSPNLVSVFVEGKNKKKPDWSKLVFKLEDGFEVTVSRKNRSIIVRRNAVKRFSMNKDSWRMACCFFRTLLAIPYEPDLEYYFDRMVL